MKTLSKILLCTFIMLFFHIQAMGAETFKVGVFDMQKFQKKSKAFQGVRSELKKKFDAMQQKLEQEKINLQKIDEEFRKQSMMLSLDAQHGKKQELEKKGRYYKYLRDDFAQEMKASEMEATREVTKELGKIMEKIAEQKGFSLILGRRTVGLIYYDDALEITDQVTEAYDRSKQ